MSRFDPLRIARWCVLAVVVATPLATTALPLGLFPVTHDVVELPKQAAARILVWSALALFTGALAVNGGSVRLSKAWWVLCAWLGWTAISTATSLGPATSLIGRAGRLDGLISAAVYAACAFLGAQLLSSAEDRRALLRAAVVGSLAVSGYALLQNLGIEPLRYLDSPTVFGVGRAFSTLGNPVFLGGYLVLVLPGSLALAVSDRSVAWRWTGLAGLAVGMPALLVTFTRGAWLAGTLEAIVLIVLLLRRRSLSSLSVWTGVGIGAIWAIALSVRSLKSTSQFSNIIERSTVAASGSIAERLLIWRALVSATQARPVFGWGPDMIPAAFEHFRSPQHVAEYPQSLVDNAHNWPLQLSVGSGILGALLGVGVWIMALAGTAREALSRASSRDSWVVSGLWLGLAGYSVYLLSAVATTGSQAIAWVFVGALLGARCEVREVEPVVAGRLVAWTCGVLAAVLVLWTLGLVIADNRYLAHRARIRGEAPGDALAAVRVSLLLSPHDARYLAGAGQAWLGRTQAAPDDASARAAYTAAIEAYSAALRADPGDWRVSVALVQALRAGGRDEEAARVLQEAREIAPRNPYLKAVQ